MQRGKRHWLWGVLVAAAVWAAVGRLAEIERVAETLARGQWQWVLAAAALQGIYYLAYAALYQSAFRIVGVESRVRGLLPVWFTSIVVNVAAPTAGPAVFIDDAARRGQSAARAAAGVILVRAADLGTFLLVLVTGMGFLLLRHDLRPYEILAALVLTSIAGGWTSLLLLGLQRPEGVRRWLDGLQRAVNGLAARFRRPALLPADWAGRTAAEFTQAASAIAARPRTLLRTMSVALAAHLVSLSSLYALFLAFHQPVGPGVLVAGFAMGILFWIVSLTPEGIGVVEGMMALVYASLGVPAARALVIALAFRGLTFWLPLAVGFFFLQRRTVRPGWSRGHHHRSMST